MQDTTISSTSTIPRDDAPDDLELLASLERPPSLPHRRSLDAWGAAGVAYPNQIPRSPSLCARCVFWSEDNEPVPLVKIGAPRHTRPLYRSDGHKLKLQSVHKIMDYQKTRPARNALALRAAVKLEHPVLSDPVYSFAFVPLSTLQQPKLRNHLQTPWAAS